MRWTLTLALGALLSACSGGGGGGPTHTLAELEAARGQVHGFQPWEQAETSLKTALGEPDSVEGDTWKWVGRDGEACHTLSVTKMAKTVGTVSLEPSACP